MDTHILSLCNLCRGGHYKGPGSLVQVGYFEESNDAPGLLIDGECKTCKGSSNRCTHTRIFKLAVVGVDVEGAFLLYLVCQCVLATCTTACV
jgi:hypothetical protein